MSEIAEMTAAVRELAPDTPVPLPRISRVIGWSPDAQSDAVLTGAVDTLPIPPAGRRGYMVSRDEALRILAAAVLALALGVAVVAVLRGTRESGFDITRLVA